MLENLPIYSRKTKRKGLRMVKDGLRLARQERYTMLRKKYFKNMIDEEAEEEVKRSKKKSTI